MAVSSEVAFLKPSFNRAGCACWHGGHPGRKKLFTEKLWQRIAEAPLADKTASPFSFIQRRCSPSYAFEIGRQFPAPEHPRTVVQQSRLRMGRKPEALWARIAYATERV
jgi:hypothetical protein